MRTWFLVVLACVALVGCKSEAEREYDKEKAKAKAQLDAFRETAQKNQASTQKNEDALNLFKLRLIEVGEPFKRKTEEWVQWGKDPNRTSLEIQQSIDAIDQIKEQSKQATLNLLDTWNAKNPKHQFTDSEINAMKVEIHESFKRKSF